MADIETYGGASHFATDANYEVQRQNHFEIQINLSGLNPPLSEEYNKAIRLCCTSAPVPSFDIGTHDLRHGNEVIKVAGTANYGDMQISVYDVIGRDMASLVQEWGWRVFNPVTHTMGLVSSYKTTATLFCYSPDASSYRKWVCYGVFPKSISFGQYSADGNGQPVSISMTLSVDKTEFVPSNGAVRMGG